MIVCNVFIFFILEIFVLKIVNLVCLFINYIESGIFICELQLCGEWVIIWFGFSN